MRAHRGKKNHRRWAHYVAVTKAFMSDVPDRGVAKEYNDLCRREGWGPLNALSWSAIMLYYPEAQRYLPKSRMDRYFAP